MTTKTGRTKTQAIATGEATHGFDRLSFLSIVGKDDRFDYSWQLRTKAEEGGGVTMDAWESINAESNTGEKFAGGSVWSNRGGKGELRVGDVILCKRPKEISAMFREREIQKYNANINLIRQAAPNARAALRKREAEMGIEPRANAVDGTTGIEFSQVAGPTQA